MSTKWRLRLRNARHWATHPGKWGAITHTSTWVAIGIWTLVALEVYHTYG